jgi:glutathione S-transferase
MITLYSFGPAFGLPDPSPFVTKAEVLLKMAGLDYRRDTSGFTRAPKGKLPYIADDGIVIADSTLIRFHLEQRYAIDFDLGLAKPGRAVAWAFEKLLEDHLYWGMMIERWMDKANFERGPKRFFKAVPAPLRPLIIAKVNRDFKRTVHGQGLGRHSAEERATIMRRAIDALADQIGDGPWLMGDVPCGADATAFAFVAGMLSDVFEGSILQHAAQRPNLAAYRDRGLARWFADLQHSN